MIPAPYTLTIYAGDSHRTSIRLPDLSPYGGPRDLANASVKAQLRQRPRDADVIQMAATITNTTDRTVLLTLTPEQTAALPGEGVWDLQVETGSGSGRWVGTPLAGKFKTIAEVSR